MMRAGFLVAAVAAFPAAVQGENFLECPIDSLSVTWILDASKTMASSIPVFETAAGTIYLSHVDIEDEVRTLATSMMEFEDKPVDPFGKPDDECIGADILLFADDSADVAGKVFILGDGGDDKDSQLDGLYGAVTLISDLEDAIQTSDSLGTEVNFVPEPRSVPAWIDIAEMKDVFVLVTDSRPHVSADGPEGLPPPPNSGISSMSCENYSYPELSQIAKKMKRKNFSLLVMVKDKADVTFYEEFFAEMEVPTVVTQFYDSTSETLKSYREALNQLVCDQSSTSTSTSTTVRTMTTTVTTTKDGCDPSKFDLQLLHLQDISASYKNDLPNIKKLFPRVVTSLVEDFHSVDTGLGVFEDKPISPFGQAKVDTCYKLVQNFTDNVDDFVQVLSKLKTHSGLDWKESQLDAMVRSMQDEQVKWTEGTQNPDGEHFYLRVVVVATDAGYHVKGEYTPAIANDNCLGRDYPSIEEVKNALLEKDILPLFITTSDVKHIYEDLLEGLESEGGAVRLIADDSEDIVSAIEEGVNDICAHVTRRLRAQGYML